MHIWASSQRKVVGFKTPRVAKLQNSLLTPSRRNVLLSSKTNWLNNTFISVKLVTIDFQTMGAPDTD